MGKRRTVSYAEDVLVCRRGTDMEQVAGEFQKTLDLMGKMRRGQRTTRQRQLCRGSL